MSSLGLFQLRPTETDRAVARVSARVANPPFERSLRVVTWLADEKIVLGAVALIWAYANFRDRKSDMAHQADRMLCAVAVAGAMPHVFKKLVARKRPNRVVPHHVDSGIPKSGKAWDSFPSGHAVHLGALAGSLRQLLPPRFRPFVWPGVIALAGTRVMLLAHYVTDVVAGLSLGVLIDKLVGRFIVKQ